MYIRSLPGCKSVKQFKDEDVLLSILLPMLSCSHKNKMDAIFDLGTYRVDHKVCQLGANKKLF
jgi:hypothetical protein